MKRCTKCKKKKSFDQFGRRSKSKDRHNSWCFGCTRLGMNKRYATDPLRRAAIRRATALQIAKNKETVRHYLRCHPCVDCTEPDDCVLEFDHVTGEKSGNISRMVRTGTSTETLLVEIAKCEVRCANCHRRKTRHTLW